MNQIEVEDQVLEDKEESKEEVIITFDGKNNGRFFNKRNIRYFLYGGTKRLNTLKNSFIQIVLIISFLWQNYSFL